MERTEQQKKNGRKLITALRSLPNSAQPSHYTQVEGDGRFRWNFLEVSKPAKCGTVGCAVGLAINLGLIPNMVSPVLALSKLFGVTEGRLYSLLYSASEYKGKYMSEVTPRDVADALEAEMERVP